MNPIHLRLILAEILIVHFLLWLEQNHVAGGHNDILPLDVEMCLSGGDIQKLPVNASAAPPGRQLVFIAQTVGSAASHNERT